MIKKKELLERIEKLEKELGEVAQSMKNQSETILDQAKLIKKISDVVNDIVDRQIKEDLANLTTGFGKVLEELFAEEKPKAKKTTKSKTETKKCESCTETKKKTSRKGA